MGDDILVQSMDPDRAVNEPEPTDEQTQDKPRGLERVEEVTEGSELRRDAMSALTSATPGVELQDSDLEANRGVPSLLLPPHHTFDPRYSWQAVHPTTHDTHIGMYRGINGPSTGDALPDMLLNHSNPRKREVSVNEQEALLHDKRILSTSGGHNKSFMQKSKSEKTFSSPSTYRTEDPSERFHARAFITIPYARKAVPPPLRPPRHIEDLRAGSSDPGWEWPYTDDPNDNGLTGRRTATTRPSSALYSRSGREYHPKQGNEDIDDGYLADKGDSVLLLPPLVYRKRARRDESRKTTSELQGEFLLDDTATCGSDDSIMKDSDSKQASLNDPDKKTNLHPRDQT